MILTREQWRMIGFIVAPLVLGYLINLSTAGLTEGQSGVLFAVWVSAPFLWAALFLSFWYWVGRRLGTMTQRPVRDLALGNSLTVGFMALYWFQFFLVSGAERSPALASLSQHYHLLVVPLSARIVSTVTTTISGERVSLLAYGLMIVTFTSGFWNGVRERR